jgi:tetratricopeptide (TPR) repeat protein
LALQLFSDTMTALTQRQDYLILLEQCTQLYEETVGELPDGDLVISLVARAIYGTDTQGLLPTLSRVVDQQRAALEDLDFPVAVDLGKALARLGAWEASEEHYTQALASASLGARHREPFLLNRALVRSARPERVSLAVEDLRELSGLLEGKSDQRLAQTVRAMQENLQKQLLVNGC